MVERKQVQDSTQGRIDSNSKKISASAFFAVMVDDGITGFAIDVFTIDLFGDNIRQITNPLSYAAFIIIGITFALSSGGIFESKPLPNPPHLCPMQRDGALL